MTDSAPADLRSIADYERAARELLPEAMWHGMFGDYGEAGWETNANNIDALRRVKLNPRVLVDVSHRSLATTALGRPITLPVIVSPTGHNQRVHADGEAAMARGTGGAGTIMGLSSRSSFSIDEITAAATGDLWFALYVMRDRRINEALVRQAEEAGFSALVLTVDVPGVSPRGAYARIASIAGPTDLHTFQPERANRILRDLKLPGVEIPSETEFMASLDDALTWEDLDWFRSITSMPIVIKGIQSAQDAARCRDLGVDALVVSNHGGYAMLDARPTIEVLPEVVAVSGDTEVFVDGGVRHGADVLKFLALGARGVLVGRATLWGLAVGGSDGVTAVLDLLRDELDTAMALCGVTDVTRVDPGLVAAVGGSAPFAGT